MRISQALKMTPLDLVRQRIARDRRTCHRPSTGSLPGTTGADLPSAGLPKKFGYAGQMGEPLTIGCTLPTSGAAADPTAIGALAQTAEQLGFDAVWISDHVVVPTEINSSYPYSADGSFPTEPTQPYLEPLSALGFLAGITHTVRLGVAVLVMPYRHPLLTGKMIATLDNLSGGRIDLGIGAGWMREEFEALGISNDIYEHRGSATDEQIRILKSVWTEETAAYDGRFYRFPRLGAHPHPAQKPHPPIWVGGHTPPALRRTARLGDGWLPIGGRPPADLPPQEVRESIAKIRAEAQRIGRDPGAIRVKFDATVDFNATGGQPFSGSSERIAEQLQSYLEVGVESLLISFGRRPPGDYERCMRQFAEQVRPALQGRVAV
jgi:probable F420-dependent oxidoreductase